MSQEADSEGLEPIPSEQRSMRLTHYIPLWWSSLIIVQAFAVAFFALYPHGELNLLQATAAVVIGTFIVTLFFILNGFPGYEDGIPFVVQTRSAFGTRGATIPNYIRIIPAIAWFGIGNWIGAVAINTITSTLWGFGYIRVYFILFLLLNLALAWEGITSIKWFDSVAGGFLVVLLGYLVYIVLSTKGIPPEVINYGGTWGLPFFTLIAATVGFIITGALNASDLSRHLEIKNGARNHILGYFFGIIPPMIFMMLVGLTVGAATGNPNPIPAIMDVAPNPAVGVVLMIFILGAQISTNLTLNILPPAHVFQDSLGVSWKTGVLITGVLSIASFPWLLFTSNYFYLFINSYSVFLGPALGVLLADYWIISKRDTDLSSLYDTTEESKFRFVRGFSITGVGSMIIGALVSIPLVNLSWMIGLPIAFLIYVVLEQIDFNQRINAYVYSGRPSSSEAD